MSGKMELSMKPRYSLASPHLFVAFLFILVLMVTGCGGNSPGDPANSVQKTLIATQTVPGLDTSTPEGLTPTIAVDREIYLGQPAPGLVPEMFLPGLVSTEGIELYLALHPNLKEAYFTRVARGRSMILVTYLEEDEWSEPVLAPFSSEFQDVGPFITPDGQRLYFWSNRPLTPTTPLLPKYQIWVVERDGNSWGEPRNLDMPIDSKDGEWDVSVTNNGHIYYMANYPSLGGPGLYMTQEIEGVYQMPTKVDALSNQDPLIELEPVVSPDEGFIIFYSVGREDNLTPDGRVGDLYISFRQPSGKWSEPENLGPSINSEAEEATPALSPDGRFLFFVSNRDAPTNFPDIYWVSMDAVLERAGE
jgi:hypothetical protein